MKLPRCFFFLLLFAHVVVDDVRLAAESSIALQNWPHWRGPTGNSISPYGRPPISWSETENVKWKVSIPGDGSGSPIVWEDKIFLVTAVAESDGA